MGKGPFLADLELLLCPKREQGDKSENNPLLHTFVQGGSIWKRAVFSQRVSEGSQFLRFSLLMLIYGIHVQIRKANTAVQGGIHIQGLIHPPSTGMTEGIWVTEPHVPTIISGQECLKHTTGPLSRVISVS